MNNLAAFYNLTSKLLRVVFVFAVVVNQIAAFVNRVLVNHINLGRFLSRLRRVFRVFANYFGGCSLFFILFHRLFVLSDISCIWHKFILSFPKFFL